jgi:hypothetical protein
MLGRDEVRRSSSLVDTLSVKDISWETFTGVVDGALTQARQP